ncbi:uncharacterized protein LOC127860274 isoform X1 [Dreissena polymorpha]|uniref:uncharacterized protein LOC127860274 isoform X1 n=2 Tax=Dreissena polymorpha TaxID=45954 RepID=UPI0022655401|nr:uncharacterized protein LOC127860274 isoform X1 [Dreissena polymorpha]XP_052254230.1 uncharacterized protein LOC127860274 isoform X1 [Dreissena polymorpha]
MASEGELACRLHDWVTNEMHFYPQGSHASIPKPEQLKLLCRGPCAPIWQWVIKHVRSTETVKTVTGNLALKNKSSSPQYRVNYGVGGEQFEETKCALLERRAALSGEVTTTLRDVGHFEHEVERITAEVTETENKYQQLKMSINTSRRKAALLTAYCARSADVTAQYGEYVKVINTRVQDIKQRAQKTLETEEFYSREVTQDEKEEEEQTSALETASAKHVRESCELIGQFLQDMLSGTFANDKSLINKHKEPLWQKVEHVCGTFSADQVMTGLLTYTSDTTSRLRTLTARVDIRRDAQALRFRYDGGEMKDLANQPSLYRSVHQLLQERNKEHFLSFIQCQKSQNDARNLEQSVAMVKSRIDKKLEKVFAQKAADLKLARTLADTEIEVDGHKAALHSLSTECESLKELVDRSARHRQELFTKYHRIQEFQEITDAKQGVIQVLVKQNMNAQSRLDQQLAEIGGYLERSFVSQPSHLTTTSGKLRDSVQREVDSFANLALPYIMFSQIDSALKTAVMDLSIHQLSPVHIRPALQTVLELLNFKTFQAPDALLCHCVRLKEEIGEVLRRLERESQHTRHRNMSGEEDVVTQIRDTCERARESDKRQITQMLPMLQQKVAKTTVALDNCNKTRDAANAWWREPGQSCVPWVKVDDRTLQQYMDQWTVLVTSLRQHLLQ